MKRSKEDYRGWALFCIAREIERVWVKKTWGGSRWLTRLHYLQTVNEDQTELTVYLPSSLIHNFILDTKSAHWPGKAAMIRELQRQLDEYIQLHENPLALAS